MQKKVAAPKCWSPEIFLSPDLCSRKNYRKFDTFLESTCLETQKKPQIPTPCKKLQLQNGAVNSRMGKSRNIWNAKKQIPKPCKNNRSSKMGKSGNFLNPDLYSLKYYIKFHTFLEYPWLGTQKKNSYHMQKNIRSSKMGKSAPENRSPEIFRNPHGLKSKKTNFHHMQQNSLFTT